MRLGVIDNFVSAPLIYCLKNSLIDHPYQIVIQSAEQNIRDLASGKLDAAFVSVLDYARDTSGLKILNDIAIFNTRSAQYALLYFRENLRDFSRIAYQGQQDQYFHLANIIIQEFYRMDPQWEVVNQTEATGSILQKYPAYFISGEPALEAYFKNSACIDMIEEWCEQTDLHFIHYIVAVNKEFDDTEKFRFLYLSREVGIRNINKMAIDFSANKLAGWDYYFDVINETFGYLPTEKTWRSLEEFYRYLFFYGAIDFIPDVFFTF